HSATQRLQSIQVSGLITRKLGPSWKQSVGQTSTQSVYLQRMQFSVTTKVMAVSLTLGGSCRPASANGAGRGGGQAAASSFEMAQRASFRTSGSGSSRAVTT